MISSIHQLLFLWILPRQLSTVIISVKNLSFYERMQSPIHGLKCLSIEGVMLLFFIKVR